LRLCPICRAESVFRLGVGVLGVGASSTVELPNAAVAAGNLDLHILLLAQLGSVAVADDTRVESEEEEDGVGDEEQDFANAKDASATLFNLFSGRRRVGRRGTVVVAGVHLSDTLLNEGVLERLVEEGDSEGDKVGERGDQLDPEEDGEHSDEFTRANEGSDQTSEGDERKDGEHDTRDDYVRPQTLGEVHIVLVTFGDDGPSETRAKTGSDEGPKAEDEDAKADGDAETEFLGRHS
jgi:hypothetical protein